MNSELKERYAEPHRHYHTIEHIQAMANMFEERFAHTPLSDRIALFYAIMYHDAIYQPGATDNEEQSALLAEREISSFLEARMYHRALIETVMRLVRSTAAHEPAAVDEQILSDLDLAILGSPPDEYDLYVRKVRAEFAAYPDAQWEAGRRNFLKSMLRRPRLFYFLDDLEKSAEENMRRELANY